MFWGDSICRGQGVNTATGALRSGLRLWEDGTEVFVYPSTAPTPQSGHIKAFTDYLLDNGATAVNLFRRGVVAAEDDTTAGQLASLAANDAFIAGKNNVTGQIISVGTNDCQSIAEADEAYERYLSQVISFEQSYHNGRTIFLLPSVVQPGPSPTFNHPNIDYLRGRIRALCLLSPHRGYVEGNASYLGVDGVHLSDTGYNTQGAAAGLRYLGLS